MGMLQTEERTIGGRVYTLRVLNVAQGRKVYSRIQRYLGAWTDAEANSGLGPLMSVAIMGGLGDDDIAFLAEVFGPTTTVDMGDGRTLTLKDPKHVDELFAGAFEAQVEWLEACVDFNFRGVIEKMKGVLQKLAAAPEPKA